MPRVLRAGIALYAAVLILAVYPYSPLPTVDIKILVTHAAAFVLVALCAVAEWRGQLPGGRPRLVLGFVAAFVVANFVASTASQYPMNGLVMTARFFSLAVLYYVTARAYSNVRQASALFLTIVVAAGAASVYGFCQRVGLDPLPWDTSLAAQEQYKHLPSTYGNPNLAGHVLTLTILCAVFLVFQRGRRWVALLVPLFVAHLAVTQHWASWLGLIASTIFAVIAWRERSRGPDVRRGVRATLVAFAFVAAILGVSGSAALMARSGRAAPMNGSLLLRYNSFYGAARMIADRPLLGVGPDNYRILNIQYWTPYEQEHFARNRLQNEHPHNEFLGAAISAGVPGLLLYVLILVRGFTAGLCMYFGERDAALRRFGFACAACALVFAIDGTMGFNLYAPVSGGLLFLILGLLDGVHSADEDLRPVPSRWPPMAATGLAAIAGVCAALAAVIFSGQIYLARGHSAMYWKAYRAAIEQYERAATLTPWDGMPTYHAAQARAAAGDLPGALEELTVSLRHNPRYVPSLLQAAFIEFDLATTEPPTASPNVLEAARTYAREAQKLCPPLPEAEDILGRAALLEADRLRARPENTSADRERLLLEAADRFARAIAYGATNERELSELQTTVRAMLTGPSAPSR